MYGVNGDMSRLIDIGDGNIAMKEDGKGGIGRGGKVGEDGGRETQTEKGEGGMSDSKGDMSDGKGDMSNDEGDVSDDDGDVSNDELDMSDDEDRALMITAIRMGFSAAQRLMEMSEVEDSEEEGEEMAEGSVDRL